MLSSDSRLNLSDVAADGGSDEFAIIDLNLALNLSELVDLVFGLPTFDGYLDFFLLLEGTALFAIIDFNFDLNLCVLLSDMDRELEREVLFLFGLEVDLGIKRDDLILGLAFVDHDLLLFVLDLVLIGVLELFLLLDREVFFLVFDVDLDCDFVLIRAFEFFLDLDLAALFLVFDVVLDCDFVFAGDFELFLLLDRGAVFLVFDVDLDFVLLRERLGAGLRLWEKDTFQDDFCKLLLNEYSLKNLNYTACNMPTRFMLCVEFGI